MVDRKEACLSSMSVAREEACHYQAQPDEQEPHPLKYLLGICGKQAFGQATEGMPPREGG